MIYFNIAYLNTSYNGLVVCPLIYMRAPFGGVFNPGRGTIFYDKFCEIIFALLVIFSHLETISVHISNHPQCIQLQFEVVQ